MPRLLSVIGVICVGAVVLCIVLVEFVCRSTPHSLGGIGIAKIWNAAAQLDLVRRERVSGTPCTGFEMIEFASTLGDQRQS